MARAKRAAMIPAGIFDSQRNRESNPEFASQPERSIPETLSRKEMRGDA